MFNTCNIEAYGLYDCIHALAYMHHLDCVILW